MRALQEPTARYLYQAGAQFRFLLNPTAEATADESLLDKSGNRDHISTLDRLFRGDGTPIYGHSGQVDPTTPRHSPIFGNNNNGKFGSGSGSNHGGFPRRRLVAGLELCQATFEKDVPYLRLLLQFGCPPDATDYDRRTAAHIACAENCLSAAITLLEFHADFHSQKARDRWGRTPLEEARLHGHNALADAITALVGMNTTSNETLSLGGSSNNGEARFLPENFPCI